MPKVNGKEYPYTKAGKAAAKKAQGREKYNKGGYASISDMEKSCNSKVELNTMK